MLRNKIGYLLIILTSLSMAEQRHGLLNNPQEEDSVQVALEVGAQNDEWSPGLHQDILTYDVEGAEIWYVKAKLKIDQTDVLSGEYFNNFASSKNQDELLKEVRADSQQPFSLDGFYVLLHISNWLDVYYDIDFFRNISFRIDYWNFIGDGTLTQHGVFWTGAQEGVMGRDYDIVRKGDFLSFQTKFESYKLFYTKEFEHWYFSPGIYYLTWSKPTFLYQYLANRRLPVVYDTTYESACLSLGLGSKSKWHDIKLFADAGLYDDVSMAQGLNLGGKEQVIIGGATADFNVPIGSSSWNWTIGAYAQYSQVSKDSNELQFDGEFNWGSRTGIQYTFSL